jgi:hypothetical protein
MANGKQPRGSSVLTDLSHSASDFAVFSSAVLKEA